MSTFALKLIAVITMLIDHAAATFSDILPKPVVIVMHIVGRFAMPIFCFLVAQGLFYSKNVQKYLARLFAFALISEIPFDLCLKGSFLEFTTQNVFFTLFLGLLGIMLFDFFAAKNLPVLSLISILACAAAAYLIESDYDAFGVLFVFIFYMCRGNNFRMAMFFTIAVFTFFTMQALLHNGITTGTIVNLAQLGALPLLLFYNGKKGFSGKTPTQSKALQYGFYLFYPVHLVTLFFLGRIF